MQCFNHPFSHILMLNSLFILYEIILCHCICFTLFLYSDFLMSHVSASKTSTPIVTAVSASSLITATGMAISVSEHPIWVDVQPPRLVLVQSVDVVENIMDSN